MANLIQISNNKISDYEVKTVNARELHQFLEIKSRFNDWINNRIRDFGFLENQDFVTVTKNLVSGGSQKEIYLSIDMAKELSMVERNEKGKQARQYFIEMEKVAKSTDPMMLLNDPVYLRGALATYSERVIELTPKAEAFDRLATKSEGAMNLTNAAKHLQMQPRAFTQFLFAHGWIYKRTVGSAWIAYQDKLQRGYLEHKAYPVTQSDGTEKIYPQVLVTAKGLAKLSTLLNKVAA